MKWMNPKNTPVHIGKKTFKSEHVFHPIQKWKSAWVGHCMNICMLVYIVNYSDRKILYAFIMLCYSTKNYQVLTTTHRSMYT